MSEYEKLAFWDIMTIIIPHNTVSSAEKLVELTDSFVSNELSI